MHSKCDQKYVIAESKINEFFSFKYARATIIVYGWNICTVLFKNIYIFLYKLRRRRIFRVCACDRFDLSPETEWASFRAARCDRSLGASARDSMVVVITYRWSSLGRPKIYGQLNFIKKLGLARKHGFFLNSKGQVFFKKPKKDILSYSLDPRKNIIS